MERVLLPLTLLLLLPSVPAGAPYHDEDTIGPGAFAGMHEMAYGFHAEEGELVAATLVWADADARLFLEATLPGGLCFVTDPVCIVGAVAQHELCATTSAGPGLYSSPQTLVFEARASGSHAITVTTFASAVDVPYELTIAIGDGGLGRVNGPHSFPANGVNANPAYCAALHAP